MKSIYLCTYIYVCNILKVARSYTAFEVISAYLKSHPNTNHQLSQSTFFDCAIIFCWPLIPSSLSPPPLPQMPLPFCTATAAIHSDPFHIWIRMQSLGSWLAGWCSPQCVCEEGHKHIHTPKQSLISHKNRKRSKSVLCFVTHFVMGCFYQFRSLSFLFLRHPRFLCKT